MEDSYERFIAAIEILQAESKNTCVYVDYVQWFKNPKTEIPCKGLLALVFSEDDLVIEFKDSCTSSKLLYVFCENISCT
jgi:hypothetical protein